MDKNPQPLPEGLNVIIHVFQNGTEVSDNVEEVKEECQNTEE